jgi:hypothetical protein
MYLNLIIYGLDNILYMYKKTKIFVPFVGKNSL